MTGPFACFECGGTGHVKAECPNRTPRANTPPGARREAAPGKKEEPQTPRFCLTCSARIFDGQPEEHLPTCGQPPSTPEYIAATLAAYGIDRRTPAASTPFRDMARMPPRSEDQSRELAAAQAIEARNPGQQPTFPAAISAAAAAVIAAIPISPQPCPGEFGPGGTWIEHCKTRSERRAS